jgi:hypothetical protein
MTAFFVMPLLLRAIVCGSKGLGKCLPCNPAKANERKKAAWSLAIRSCQIIQRAFV